MLEVRPYQQNAARAVWEHWDQGVRATLLVMPTGCGKTVVFAGIAADAVRRGGRVLVLAHRGELLQQAADKIERTTGLKSAVEKAEQTASDSWLNIVVGSVQTMARFERRDGHEYTHIIVDEAHHALAASYRAILDHFQDAKVLGVTATADRGDKRNLGEFFETLAFEYALPAAIRDGWLCRIEALTIPLEIDLSGVAQTAGDFAASGIGHAIDPYLEQIADHLAAECQARKTVVFLPLIATSLKFLSMLQARGVCAREVNGNSADRAETLAWFNAAGPGTVLLNAMLLNEGWDCPSVDCVCVLRPTKVRSLYAQMVGRGTRLFPGKSNLRILDFLWHSERHELCRPAHLVCDDPEISRRVAEIMAEQAQGTAVDVLDAEPAAEKTATNEREEALRKLLEEQRHRRRALVDPLQYSDSVGEHRYTPDTHDLRSLGPPDTVQLQQLEKAGINTDEVKSFGQAAELLQSLQARRLAGLSTPRQIRVLERYGFKAVGQWQFVEAKRLIDRIAGNGWRVPEAYTSGEVRA